MSLSDLQTLLDLTKSHSLGSAEMLDEYDSRRRKQVQLRVAGIHLLNRTSQSDIDWLRDMRSWGIGLLHDATPIRKTVMQMGLGLK